MTLAVLCPGQGHQHAAMLDLVARDAQAQAVLDEAGAALGRDLRAWLREPDRLFANRIAQPLICVAQLAAWRALGKSLPAPLLFAGYSVGELASHACAGAFDAGALCRAADVRARAMDDAGARNPGTMVAIDGLPRAAIAALCEGRQAWRAIDIDDTRCVVGGTRHDAEALAEAARSRGAQVHRLAVGVASHTPLMAPAVAPMRAALEDVRFAAPACPVLAGVDATQVLDRGHAIRALCMQMTATIEWGRCLRAAYERGCRVFLELGPGAALSRMVRERFVDVEARSIDDFRSLEGAGRWALARMA